MKVRLAIGVVVAALALLVLVPTAMAVVTRAKTASFGSDGTSATSFGDSSRLAFNQANDKLYVLDRSGAKLYAFNAPALTPGGGAFPLSVASGGDPDLAVDNTLGASANNLYYVANGPGNVFGFTSAGVSLGGNFPIEPTPPKYPCGTGVDSAGNLYVGDYYAGVRKYDSAGNSLGAISTTGQGNPCRVAFDANDDMFVAMYSGAVWKYTAPAYTTATEIDSASTNAIAVDTSAHRLYVAHSSKVSAYDSTTGAFLYDFARGISGEELQGVAVDQGTDQVYVSDSGFGNDKVYVFSPAQNYGDATASPTPATAITDTGATINATIDDNNALPTNWRLELSSDGGSTWSTVGSGSTAGNQSGVEVSKALTGLVPNSTYQFRVVTTKGSGFTEETSFSRFFTTVAPPPVVTNVGAIQPTDTSLRLVGTVDPRHTPTGYFFEYGSTPALGSSTAPLAIGDGTTPIVVSQVIEGLTPGTTYYVRLVATNTTGTTTSPSVTASTRATPLPLPDDRVWEQVSPVEKNLGDAANFAFSFGRKAAGNANNGNAAAWCATAAFGEPPSQLTLQCAPYVSRRTASGWETVNPFPPYCRIDTAEGNVGALFAYLSPDFSRAAIVKPEPSAEGCANPPLDPAAPAPASNPYRQNLTGGSEFHLLAPHDGGGGNIQGASAQPLGGSENFSHIVYASQVNQTDPPDSPAPGEFRKLYDWEEEGQAGCAQPGGCLSLISIDPGNVPFSTPSALPAESYEAPLEDAISSNGERVFFQNPASDFSGGRCESTSCELYMREGDSVTRDISASECTVAPCGLSQADEFLWANRDASMALLISCAKLTDESALEASCGGNPYSEIGAPAGAKLYLWDESGAPGHHLTDVTVDHEAGDGVQPNFRALLGSSEDGDTVFFTAVGQLVSGAPTGPALKIYRWRRGIGLDYLGPYLAPTGPPLGGQDPNVDLKHRLVTPDGKYLVLLTDGQMDPVADTDSDIDVYRWSQAEGWTCVSCQGPGVPSVGDTFGFYLGEPSLFNGGSEIHSSSPKVLMIDDGRIFFPTLDALLPEDVNGENGCEFTSCQDIYEWNDGTLSLISGGTEPVGTEIVGSTPSGDDVFFTTRERLVGWDVDDNVDIYDARVGGGFPEPQPQPPSCEGEACRGQGTELPNTPSAGTRVFEGPADPEPGVNKCRKGLVRRHGKCVRKRHHKRHPRHRHDRAAGQSRRAAK